MTSTVYDDRQNSTDDQPEETSRTEAVAEAYRLGYGAGKRDGLANGPRMIEMYDGYCPRWCASREDDREDHGDDHQSVPVGAYLAVGTTKEGWPATLTADLRSGSCTARWPGRSTSATGTPWWSSSLATR